MAITMMYGIYVNRNMTTVVTAARLAELNIVEIM
jgi:hypothetical protein